jgi:arabinogalactan endo-1,4-beta-galactosidase
MLAKGALRLRLKRSSLKFSPRRSNRFIGSVTFICMALLLLCSRPSTSLGAPAPFYMGGDISLESFMQQQNITYNDGGVTKPMDQIMYDHGSNLFRIRIFVNPSTTYTNQGTWTYPNRDPNYGAIQTTAYDIALAQQIKADAPGAKILLDFHYSDYWADPGKQYKPWQSAAPWSTDTTQAQLNTDVKNYTHDTLASFYAAGVMPDMVQVGNETTNGMLWQTGTIGVNGAAGVGGKLLYSGSQQNLSWQNFGGLLNSAIAGVRQVQSEDNLPRIPVALSIDHGDKNGTPQYFYGNIQSASLGNVTDYDIQGVDYYPTSNDTNVSFAYLQSNLTTLANTNYTANPANPKKIMILETNYPFASHSGIGISTWASTPAGQEAEFVAVRNLMLGLPHNDGTGVLWWDPEGVQVSNYSQGWYNGGTTALFDATSNHNALSALTDNVFAPIKGDFNGDGHFNASDIPAMLSALGDLSSYQSNRAFTDPDMKFLGDFNGDGVITNADLQGMIDALIAGQGSTDPVPEPAAGWLLGVATLAVVIQLRRRRTIDPSARPVT